jgi:beta-galactosidase
VEVCQRSGGGRSILIVINHATSSESIALPSAMKDLLSNDAAPASQLTMPAHGVAVLE